MSTASVLGGLLLLSLSACTPDNHQIGMLRDSDGRIEVLYVRCLNRNEAVRTVNLSDAESGKTLWSIRDAPPVADAALGPAVQRFVVGGTPDGFVEEVPLSAPLSESARYRLSIDGPNQVGLPSIGFELDDLSEDRVYGPVEAPGRAFVDDALEGCTPPRPPFGGLFSGRWGGLLLAAVFLIPFAVAKIRHRRRGQAGHSTG